MEADFLYLEDEVVKLRALEPEDLELLYTIENDTTLWHKGCTDVPYSRYALKQYIASQPADFYEHRQLRLLIVRKSDGKALGLIDLTSYEPQHARAEVGIVVLAAERGQGYAQRALCLLERYVAEIFRLRLLYAHVSQTHNEPCRNLFLAAGYQEVAVLPDWERRGEDFFPVSIFLKKI